MNFGLHYIARAVSARQINTGLRGGILTSIARKNIFGARRAYRAVATKCQDPPLMTRFGGTLFIYIT